MIQKFTTENAPQEETSPGLYGAGAVGGDLAASLSLVFALFRLLAWRGLSRTAQLPCNAEDRRSLRPLTRLNLIAISSPFVSQAERGDP